MFVAHEINLRHLTLPHPAVRVLLVRSWLRRGRQTLPFEQLIFDLEM